MVQAIPNALLIFDLLPTGFSNRDLRNYLTRLRLRPTRCISAACEHRA
jgi:hypothetical protein